MDTLTPPPSAATRPRPNAAIGVRPASYLRTGAGAHGWRRTLMGSVLGWRWFDTATTASLRHVFFKSSRLWAAAQLADGDPRRFCAAVPMRFSSADADRLTRTLARFEDVRATSRAMDVAWEAAFFGLNDTTLAQRSAIEARRLDARHALNGTRALFARYVARDVPRVQLDITSPDEVDRVWGGVRNGLAPFVAPPAMMPDIAVSQAIPGTVGRDYWLRFKSPSPHLDEHVTARVHEPLGIADPPTIILGHGVCIDFDHWRGLVDETDELVAAGFRVIRPEAPFHGRRATPGMFGGEAIIGSFPTATLVAFTAALQEWAVLADWARRTSSGPVCFAGTSLGAQMAQLAAKQSINWPERLRPDALLLITHCGSLGEAVMHGAIAEIFGTANDVMSKGWTPALAASYLSPLDPGLEPPIAPGRIVSILGRRDRVTPFASGEPLVRGWGLPAENQFILDRGHFSVPMTLIGNGAPLARFVEIVKAIRP